MSEPAFTPGPWSIVTGDSVVSIEARYQTRVAATNSKAYHQRFDETDLANAHLIAAAPALYEALTDIRNRILCPVGPSPSLDEVERIASAALSLALGEKQDG